MRGGVLRLGLMAALAIVLLGSCSVGESVVAMGDVSLDGWDEPVSITYHNVDTSSLLDLDVTLHVNRRFEAPSIALEITTFTPDSLRYSESVTLPVRVRWPSNRAKTTDIALPYRRDVHFAHEGEYHISLRPLQDVVGVEAAGITFQMKR